MIDQSIERLKEVPIKIPDQLPAAKILHEENIFVMHETRAIHQDIRPLNIVILNLMPNKIATETQLLRVLGNTPLQVDISLIHPKTHQSKNTPAEHLKTFYRTIDEIKDEKYDGMIITGAPVEHLSYEEVDYWPEFKEIMDWTVHNVTSTLHICWGAQAALYHHYGIEKVPMEKKVFGVFPHRIVRPKSKLLRGFDDLFYVPHSRYTDIRKEDVEKFDELEILAESEEAGLYIIARKDGKQIFVSGHSEYDACTLRDEYERDLKKGISIDIPVNYFPNDDPTQSPIQTWRSNGYLLFSNWLNYYVYQETPYDRNEIK